MKKLSVKITDLMLSILSAALLVLSFPSANISIFAWFAFVPLLIALQGKKKSEAFALAYLCGVIFFVGAIYWIVWVSVIGMIILSLFLGLYFGVFGLIISSFPICRGTSRVNIIIIPAVWVALEYIRSHLLGGFGWALLGYSQAPNLSVIQIADITGAYGLSFLVIMTNVVLYRAYIFRKLRIKEKSRVPEALVFALFFICVITYGYIKFSFNFGSNKSTKVSLVQGNIPQIQKWDPQYRLDIIQKYISLTKESADDQASLIIWPETSFPGTPESDPDLFAEIKKLSGAIHAHLLIGMPTESGPVYLNTASLVYKGQIVGKYDKVHLVPFGEYIPLEKQFAIIRKILPPIGDFIPGKENTILKVKDAKLGTLICFEDIFPYISRACVKNGANLLVNITNDAWFGMSSCPYQHEQASVFRAVEFKRSLVRAANTGVSCFISPYGEIIDRLKDKTGRNIFIAGHSSAEVPLVEDITFYAKFGDVFAYICIFITLIGFYLKPKS